MRRERDGRDADQLHGPAGQVADARPSTLTLVAPAVDPTSTERSRSVELSLDRRLGRLRVDRRCTLDFTAGDWSTAARTVYVRATFDHSSEGEGVTPIQTRVTSTAATTSGLQVANLLVRTLDDDQAGVVVTAPSGGVRVDRGRPTATRSSARRTPSR